MICTTLAGRRCPYCRHTLDGAAWRTRLAEHLYQWHARFVRGEVLNWTEDAFLALELRTTQRSLLLFAIDNPRFTIESGRDSTSLWSMSRRGWFLVKPEDDLRQRVWTLTSLGYAVARAALARVRQLGERVRHPMAAKAWHPALADREYGHRTQQQGAYL